MEDWQLSHIEKNGVKLSKNITVTTELLQHMLAAAVITDEEADKINCIAPTSERAFQFLRTAKTRPCYNFLVKALEEERQLGAVEILKNHVNFQSTEPSQSLSASNSTSSPSTKATMSNTLVVGDLDCKINRILKTLRKQPSCYKLLKSKWKDLSRDLDLSPSFTAQLENRVRIENKSELDILDSVLGEWRSTKSKAATLEEFVKQLEENDLKDLADSLRKEFGME